MKSVAVYAAWSILWGSVATFLLIQIPVVTVIQRVSIASTPTVGSIQASTSTITQSVQPWSSISTQTLSQIVTPDESAHLIDVRTIIQSLMIAGAVSILVLRHANRSTQSQATTTTIRRCVWINTCLFLLLLAISSIWWEELFTLFHQVMFPQGNWSFPLDSTLITLFPVRFWQISAAVWAVIWLGAQWMWIKIHFHTFTHLLMNPHHLDRIIVQ